MMASIVAGIAAGMPNPLREEQDAASPDPVSTSTDRQPYRPDIDGLRAVAVLSVIGFHAAGRWLPGGFVGVDVFFVISGFLISTIIFRELDQGRFSFATFYARRIRRIFPALITVFVAVGIAGWFTFMADGYRQLGRDIFAGAGFVSNIFLWRQFGYFDGDAALKPLLHLWSLGVEEQYYLVWPLAVFLTWKLGFDRLKLVLSVLVLSFAFSVGTVQFSPEAAYYLPHTRFWELMVGSALAYVLLYKREAFDFELMRVFHLRRWPAHLPEIKAWSGLAIIVAALLLVNKESLFPGWWALLPTFGTFLLISAGETARVNRKLLSNRVMVFAGLISYPLYLWHWPLLSFIRIVFGDPPRWAQVAAVLMAFALAWITYEFVEKPVRQKRSFVSQRFAVPLLVSAMVAVIAFGALSMRGHGMPARYPEALQQIAQYNPDEHMPSWRKDKCFLTLDRDWQSFDSICTDLEPADAPLVFLWGDSHAADLYPGLHQLQSRYKFRLAEYAAAECPPLLNFQFAARLKYCSGINSWVSRKIIDLKPDVVVLVGERWGTLPGRHESLSFTLAKLAESGIKQVIVVGPNPAWQNPFPRSLVLYYYRAGSLHIIPNRMTYDLDSSVFATDRQLRTWISGSAVTYLSPLDVLCNQDGCLTEISQDGTTDLTSFDHVHLTEPASRYVADKLFAPLFARTFAAEVAQATKRTNGHENKPAIR